jgi:O-succinylbenzoic acid--CoA ligase
MRDWLAIRADATPDATALQAAGDVETTVSYAALDRRIETLAGRLAARGIGVGDSLAVCAGTRVEFVDLVHAAQRLGAVIVPLHPDSTPPELDARFSRVGAEAVVCEPDTETAVQSAVDAPVLTVADPTAGAEALSAVEPESFDLPEWTADDPLVVMFTSGTTGDPAGVVLTLANVLASATASAFRLGVIPTDCWHLTLPIAHMGGLAPVYRSVLYGTALSVQRSFEPAATLQALRTADATCVSLVPTMLEGLLDAGSLPELRIVLLGGAPTPPELVERAHDRGVPVTPTYGMTETASQIASARPATAAAHPASVGHPLVFAELSVVDEQGATCGPGEVGELVVSGPVVTPGYLDDARTEAAVCPGGLRTGDRVYRDEAGRVYVEGRLDDLIVTGGENVDPESVATAIRRHAAVDDCTVVGLPDPSWGERVAALVVTDGDVTTAEIERHCRDRLAQFKHPRTVAFATALPRTPSGTVDREAVRRRLRDQAD